MTATPASGASTRLYWIDLLRGTAVLCVLVMHAALLFPFENTPRPLEWFTSATGPYRMPALMFCSGLLLPLAFRKSGSEYLWGKVMKLGWPWLLWSLLMFPLLEGSRMGDAMWWLNFHGGMHTWFLLGVFISYVVALPLRRAEPFLVAGVLFVIAWVMPDAGGWVWFVERSARMSGYFFVGAGVAARPGLLGKLPVWAGALLLGAGLVWAGLAVRAGGVDSSTVLGTFMSLAGVLGASWALTRIPRSVLTGWIEWFGRRSVVPYLVHWPLYFVMISAFGLTGGWVQIGALVVAGLAVSAVVIWCWPVTRWVFELPVPTLARPRHMV